MVHFPRAHFLKVVGLLPDFFLAGEHPVCVFVVEALSPAFPEGPPSTSVSGPRIHIFFPTSRGFSFSSWGLVEDTKPKSDCSTVFSRRGGFLSFSVSVPSPFHSGGYGGGGTIFSDFFLSLAIPFPKAPPPPTFVKNGAPRPPRDVSPPGRVSPFFLPADRRIHSGDLALAVSPLHQPFFSSAGHGGRSPPTAFLRGTFFFLLGRVFFVLRSRIAGRASDAVLSVPPTTPPPNPPRRAAFFAGGFSPHAPPSPSLSPSTSLFSPHPRDGTPGFNTPPGWAGSFLPELRLPFAALAF